MERVLRYNGRERPGVSRDDHMLTREDENPQNEPDSAKTADSLRTVIYMYTVSGKK